MQYECFIEEKFNLTTRQFISQKGGIFFVNYLGNITKNLNPELASFFHFDDKVPRCVLPFTTLVLYTYICCQFPIHITTQVGVRASVCMVGPCEGIHTIHWSGKFTSIRIITIPLVNQGPIKLDNCVCLNVGKSFGQNGMEGNGFSLAIWRKD